MKNCTKRESHIGDKLVSDSPDLRFFSINRATLTFDPYDPLEGQIGPQIVFKILGILGIFGFFWGFLGFFLGFFGDFFGDFWDFFQKCSRFVGPICPSDPLTSYEKLHKT